MSVAAIATAVQSNFPINPDDRQLALCQSALNNRLYFDEGKQRNQWAHCRKYDVFFTRHPTNRFEASKSSDKFNEILRDYHRRSTSRSKAAEMLFRDYGLIVRCVVSNFCCTKYIGLIKHLCCLHSERTIARRWKEMGLKAAHRQESELSPQEIINIVAEELEMDPEGTMGQNLIKHRIAMRTGMHLRQYVSVHSLLRCLMFIQEKPSLHCKVSSIQKRRHLDGPGQEKFVVFLWTQMDRTKHGVVMVTINSSNTGLRSGGSGTNLAGNG